MLGDSKTVGFGSIYGRLFSPPHEFVETPLRIATSGWTVADMASGIDAALAAASGTPDVILISLGTNDLLSLPAEGVWKNNYQYTIDACHAKYPNARIGLAKPIALQGSPPSTPVAAVTTLHSWIDDFITETYIFVGPNEIDLENGDGYTTFFTDSLHETDAGYAKLGRLWLTALGY